MRSNNRQRSRGGRNGGGGGGGHHHNKQHHNPNRPPNRNQIFDSSGPDVRVRGNAHQVFDKYQALAREAAASGDRIQSEAYWQYADHYFRVIQTMGGFGQRNNQGWGDGSGEEAGQAGQQPQQPNQANGNGHAMQGERPPGRDERDERGEAEPGLGGVAFLQNGRSSPADNDPGADEQPDVPEYVPGTGRRG
ncbi:MAG: DUF4167 domain-containing protein [Alphaproteobacteria bacterium]|nr:DUF4167 domain-containing protein [Alphaproteobacteria bacterium]MBV8408957.1 DUF4167 domain-containing protein [Alphaproteobacteria bacterium]